MLSNWAIKQLQHMTMDYLKIDCAEGRCYGVIAVHRVCFALVIFHSILGCLLIGVNDSRDKRAAIQNGWWGPKVLAWIALLVVSFFIPNEFFMVWGNYIALIGAAIFIIFGLILLVDFAHSWAESCLERWEMDSTNKWKYILVGSTAIMYMASIAMTGVMYAFFAHNGCSLNQFFITFNLILSIIITAMCVHPAVQEANPQSGLSQAAMVVIYCAYLIMSAVVNEPDDKLCNPLSRSNASKTTAKVLGAVFTFLAIAYSTSRAATQGKALINKGEDAASMRSALPLTNNQLDGRSSSREALRAAVESGALPASALDDEDDEEDDVGTGDIRDDERGGTLYNYAFFHLIFAIATMYVAMLLTNWHTVLVQGDNDGGPDEPDLVRIGQSYAVVWVKVASSWLCSCQTFTYHPEGNPSVVIATGTFDNWGRTLELHRDPSSNAFIGKVDLPAGGHRIYYKYVVDGEWTIDKNAPSQPDEQGNVNNYVDPPPAQEAAGQHAPPASKVTAQGSDGGSSAGTAAPVAAGAAGLGAGTVGAAAVSHSTTEKAAAPAGPAPQTGSSNVAQPTGASTIPLQSGQSNPPTLPPVEQTHGKLDIEDHAGAKSTPAATAGETGASSQTTKTQVPQSAQQIPATTQPQTQLAPAAVASSESRASSGVSNQNGGTQSAQPSLQAPASTAPQDQSQTQRPAATSTTNQPSGQTPSKPSKSGQPSTEKPLSGFKKFLNKFK
ncbi:hypothetical protein BZG36_00575 [Bifiguratus adelaidae]|uniref:AMP-activated protein kinase glycogen-binding domain-containing protein n=1 Tax=Bifiguratus adelaidae TaxID=1938954 RepID=A0A261Y784_9FUNG|nr:hypothetical protein BZG36_00575 [Bifiguratus adelaidae]